MKLTDDSFPRARHVFFYCLILFNSIRRQIFSFVEKKRNRRTGGDGIYSVLVYKHHIRGNAYFLFFVC